jgi:hypothetical protein
MKIDKSALLDTLNNPEELKRLWSLNRPLQAAASPTNTVEHTLSDWLGRLKLLHGVPFNYLVPDVDMLPMESIKFFHCDTNWLSYLADGALSIGRSASSDQVHDEAFLPRLRLFSGKSMKAERGKMLGHLSFHLNEKESRLLNAEPHKTSETITRFLLRSGVVSDWEGLQVAAFEDADQKKPCQLLRMDHLSPNVLLCMYEGIVKSIRINEHPEVLHFGFEKETNLVKSFRYLADKVVGGKVTNKAGTAINTSLAPKLIIDTYMRTTSNRVIRINQLAKDMKTTLEKGVEYKDTFTSAEFALEMVKGAEAVNFKIV